MEKLNLKQISSLTLTLFAIFFGAGNMIFPPAMGQLAGENYLQALAGFILTDAGIALLGIVAVVLLGNRITDLGNLVSRRFSLCLSVTVYLLIGPLFAPVSKVLPLPVPVLLSFPSTPFDLLPQDLTF